MNNANYQGISNWQVLTHTAYGSKLARERGRIATVSGSAARGVRWVTLYYESVGLAGSLNTVRFPRPPNRVGPFRNFQPDRYWSNSSGGGQQSGNQNPIPSFNFVDGSQGGGTGGDFQYILPMIQGKIPGTPLAWGPELQVNPDGQTVYGQ